jgi:hypothetical protein
MDYYSSLNSMSQQSSSLDYAGSQLLEQGTQGYTAQMEGFQNDFSKEIGDINAEYQGNIAQITGAFARKDTAQEQLVATLEGAGGALEITKSAKSGYDKYIGEAKDTATETTEEGEGMISDLKAYGRGKVEEFKSVVRNKANELSGQAEEYKGQAQAQLDEFTGQVKGKFNELQGGAESKMSEVEGKLSDLRGKPKKMYDDMLDDRVDTTEGVELQPQRPRVAEARPKDEDGEVKEEEEGAREVKGEPVEPTELQSKIDATRDTYKSPFAELKENLPSVPDREPSEIPEVPTEAVGGEAEGVVGGVETALEGGSAVALEETAGEVAVAGAFDPVVDVIAGGLMLAGVGVGVYDLFTKKKTEKKIKKKEENAEKVSQAEQDASQAQYDAQVKATAKSYDTIRNNITANTHAGVAIGVQNMRNTYKSGGTF